MLVKFNIDNDVFQKIKQLVEQKRYQDLNEFLNIAVNNQVTEEFANLTSNIVRMESPPKEADISLKEIDDFLAEKGAPFEETLDPNWRKILQKIEPGISDIEPYYDDLIWSFYNRFLPVKIVIYRLATLLKGNLAWIELTDLQTLSYNLATKISEGLREYEEQYDLARNQRLSTGLPTPESERERVKKIREKRKIVEKIESNRKRFMEQFVGRKIRSEGIDQFSGACFDMGLLAVRFTGNNVSVNLTQTGKEFSLFRNPVIEDKKMDVAFSHEEVRFILEKIIPKFKFEKIIIDKILKELKNNKLSSDEINDIFKEEKMKFLKEKGESVIMIEKKTDEGTIVRERVATMSRLSELGLVKWDIDKTGQSSYSLKIINP